MGQRRDVYFESSVGTWRASHLNTMRTRSHSHVNVRGSHCAKFIFVFSQSQGDPQKRAGGESTVCLSLAHFVFLSLAHCRLSGNYVGRGCCAAPYSSATVMSRLPNDMGERVCVGLRPRRVVLLHSSTVWLRSAD